MKVLCGLLRRGLWHDGWHDDFQWYQFSDLFHPNAPLFQLKSMLEPFQGGLLEAIQWHSAVFRIAGILCVLAVGTLRYTPHTHTHQLHLMKYWGLRYIVQLFARLLTACFSYTVDAMACHKVVTLCLQWKWRVLWQSGESILCSEQTSTSEN